MGQPQPPHDPRGALVRPYAVTRGRTEPQRNIPIEAVLVASQAAVQESRFAGHDKYRIAVLCEAKPQSLAELSAHLRQPLGVTRKASSNVAWVMRAMAKSSPRSAKIASMCGPS